MAYFSKVKIENATIDVRDVGARTLISKETSARQTADSAFDGRITALDARVDALENLKHHNAIYVNVKDYGAVGDGTTDDTAAFQSAMAIINDKGGVLYVPQGRYKISETLHFTHYGSTLKGETPQGVYLVPTFGNKPVVEFGNGSVPALISCRVENIAIVLIDVAPTQGNTGIFFNYVVNSSIDNVIIGECLIGVRLCHAGNTFLNNVGVTSNKANSTGFFIGTNSVSINIENCYAGFMTNAADSSIGLYAGEGNVADFTVNYFDVGNGLYGVIIDGSNSPAETPPTDIRLNNVVVDGSRNACIRLLNIPQRGGIVIDGGWLNPLAVANNKCIQMIDVHNVHIKNVHMQQLADSAPGLIGVTGSNAYGCSIEGCIFSNINSPVSLATCNRLIVADNMIYVYDGFKPSSYGIYIISGSNALICNNVIKGSYLVGAAVDATGNYCAIIGNIAEGAATGFTNPQADGLIVNNIAH